jgi:Protein of unknown function (DUF1571)
MNQLPWGRRDFLRALAASGASCLAVGECAAEPNGNLREPIHRVANATNPVNAAAPAPMGAPAPGNHPLDPALDVAFRAQKLIQDTIDDYTCSMMKQERIKGVLGEIEYLESKIRNRKIVNGKIVQPLSVYLKFTKPKSVEGREVIWVEGKNNNKLRAHEGGTGGRFLPSVWLDPDGMLAMRNQLHPISDIGLENLVEKLIERGQKERQFGECEVTFKPGAAINKRPCTVLEVMHPVQRKHFEFHLAQIFIDDELQIPVRYVAYDWPARVGAKELPVIEQYTHYNIKLNVGLTDADFDSENPNYNF